MEVSPGVGIETRQMVGQTARPNRGIDWNSRSSPAGGIWLRFSATQMYWAISEPHSSRQCFDGTVDATTIRNRSVADRVEALGHAAPTQSQDGAAPRQTRAPPPGAPSSPGTSAAPAGNQPGRPCAARGARPSPGSRNRQSTTRRRRIPVPCQASVHHAIQAPGLGHEALQAVAPVGLVLQRHEMVDLPRHRAETAHLEHQPFERRDPLERILGQELARSSRPGRSGSRPTRTR